MGIFIQLNQFRSLAFLYNTCDNKNNCNMVLLVVNMFLCVRGPSTLKKDNADKNKSAPTCLTRCAEDDETQQCHQRFYAG